MTLLFWLIFMLLSPFLVFALVAAIIWSFFVWGVIVAGAYNLIFKGYP